MQPIFVNRTKNIKFATLPHLVGAGDN